MSEDKDWELPSNQKSEEQYNSGASGQENAQIQQEQPPPPPYPPEDEQESNAPPDDHHDYDYSSYYQQHAQTEEDRQTYEAYQQQQEQEQQQNGYGTSTNFSNPIPQSQSSSSSSSSQSQENSTTPSVGFPSFASMTPPSSSSLPPTSSSPTMGNNGNNGSTVSVGSPTSPPSSSSSFLSSGSTIPSLNTPGIGGVQAPQLVVQLKESIAQSRQRKLLRAVYDFTSDDSREVPFNVGDIVEVVRENDSGWWEGINRRTGKQGLIPFNYFEEVPPEEMKKSPRATPILTRGGSTSSVPTNASKPAEESKEEKLKRTKIREGFMTKRGHVVKNWKLRWFVLRKDELLYFKSELDPKACGSIILNKNSTIDYADNKKQHSFVITSGKKVLYCQARDERTMEEWMADIRMVIEYNKSIS